MGVKISELAEALNVNDEDLLPLVQNGETKKVEVQTLLRNIQEELNDLIGENWNTATITNDFILYGIGANPVKYRKIGKIIEIRGIITPATTITASSETRIFTLPNGYRPSVALHTLCQGSSKNSWLLTIGPDGACICSRYGTTTNLNITNGTWLPFHCMFSID